MKVAACIILCFLANFGQCEEPPGALHCADESASVRDCWESNLGILKVPGHESSIIIDHEILKQRVKGCFNKFKCDPIYDTDGKLTVGTQVMEKLANNRKRWQPLTNATKTCISKNVHIAALSSANECMKNKDVELLHMNELGHDLFEFIKNTSLPYSQFLNWCIQVTLNYKKCRNERGNDVAFKLMECLDDVKNYIGRRLCRKVNDCEKNLTAPCHAKSQAVKDAFCSCDRDKLLDILVVIEKLQATRRDVKKSVFDDEIHKIYEDLEKKLTTNFSSCFDNPSDLEARAFVADLAFLVSVMLKEPTRYPRIFLAYVIPDKAWVSQKELLFLHQTLDHIVEDCDCRGHDEAGDA